MADAPDKTALDQEQFDNYLKNPILFPEAFKDWISDWYAQNVPKLHVSQIFGFKLQSINVADDINAAESTTSASYVDLATVGPTLPNLGNGFYVVMWGCLITSAGRMGISVDGATPTGQYEMLSDGTDPTGSVGRMALVDISSGNNDHSIVAKYKQIGCKIRWLHALKVVTEDA